ncbi:FGGY-family pentulose kinase [Klebsiella pneumoniae]|uniref:FGGY-family pentulose kinase n=1 Tax=Klebsiella pneumoniae TaxID=573 RepID=A0A2X3ERY7_KLEPN|nr:FGGY-family pentulose kinase [Klebsiella pneumoniae]
MQNDTQNIIGVDVGSGSVRAGVFNLRASSSPTRPGK